MLLHHRAPESQQGGKRKKRRHRPIRPEGTHAMHAPQTSDRSFRPSLLCVLDSGTSPQTLSPTVSADGTSSCALQFIVFPQTSKSHVVTELWVDPQAGKVVDCAGAYYSYAGPWRSFGCISVMFE